MEDTPKTRRCVVDALSPDKKTYFRVTVSASRLRASRRSLGQLKEAAYIVPMVLKDPDALFKGLRRDDDEPKDYSDGWLCYAGRPLKTYRKDGKEVDPWPGEVFLVFVSADRVAYDWYWYEAAPNDPNAPADHAVRFKERLL